MRWFDEDTVSGLFVPRCWNNFPCICYFAKLPLNQLSPIHFALANGGPKELKHLLLLILFNLQGYVVVVSNKTVSLITWVILTCLSVALRFARLAGECLCKDCGFRLGLFLTVDTLCSEGKGIGLLEWVYIPQNWNRKTCDQPVHVKENSIERRWN